MDTTQYAVTVRRGSEIERVFAGWDVTSAGKFPRFALTHSEIAPPMTLFQAMSVNDELMEHLSPGDSVVRLVDYHDARRLLTLK